MDDARNRTGEMDGIRLT